MQELIQFQMKLFEMENKNQEGESKQNTNGAESKLLKK